MRTIPFLFGLLLSPAALAWQCPLSTGLWPPAATLAPAGPLVARSSSSLHVDQLLAGQPRFVEANGSIVPAEIVERGPDHAVLRPTRPLTLGVEVGLQADNAPAWPFDRRWKVAAPPPAPKWKEDPNIVQSTEEEAPYGLKWWRSVRVNAPGAGLVRATLKPATGRAVTRDLPVIQDKVRIGSDGCESTFPASLPGGEYTLELVLVDGAGQPGEQRSLPFVIPKPPN